MEKRSGEKFVINKAFTERYRRSAIPNMQRLLNTSEREKKKMFKRIDNSVPVNYDFQRRLSSKFVRALLFSGSHPFENGSERPNR